MAVKKVSQQAINYNSLTKGACHFLTSMLIKLVAVLGSFSSIQDVHFRISICLLEWLLICVSLVGDQQLIFESRTSFFLHCVFCDSGELFAYLGHSFRNQRALLKKLRTSYSVAIV